LNNIKINLILGRRKDGVIKKKLDELQFFRLSCSCTCHTFIYINEDIWYISVGMQMAFNGCSVLFDFFLFALSH